MNDRQNTPLVLVILDGWGLSLVRDGNAIALAQTPTMDEFSHFYPSAAIYASGLEVGLPWGEIGNSETGHRNIGAGKIQYQSLPRIDAAIADGSFFKNKILLNAIHYAQQHGSKLHLMGLVSTGGVHSHINHLYALLEMCRKEQMLHNVYIHMFTDGRDSPPQSALAFLTSLEEAIEKLGVGIIASVTGRFYSMDRNQNRERTLAAYNMLIGAQREHGAPDARSAIEQAYEQHIFDEMIPPTAITKGGVPIGAIEKNDSVMFFNFRPDRARQISQLFASNHDKLFTILTQYDPDLPAEAAFIEEKGEMPLAKVISDAGLSQLHVAETEKYAHVTYYLNVGHEEPFEGEKRVMIPSSNAITFAQEPHMQAEPITDAVIEAMRTQSFHVYFVNFANADMVGHTGNLEAAKEACSFVDQCIGRIKNVVLENSGVLLVTADHGNAEEMVSPATGEPDTEHTGNPVPLHVVKENLKRTTPKTDEEIAAIVSSPIGVLTDVAPTVLDILGIPKPAAMTGISLLPSLQ